ncbi:hypothetical protein K7432_007879 [Basidiobolus ranarum]|uniref:Peptidase C51 domain-containing protein n=1 Tax=Basidiobolus ranarum TaxID=34480 RepID=A0ABR2VZI9_9FUNG
MLFRYLLIFTLLFSSALAVEQPMNFPQSNNRSPNRGRGGMRNRYPPKNRGKSNNPYLEFRFKNGQCTDWADARYFQLSGYHTEWWGDARYWPLKAARTNGWVVSNTPKIPSLIVIQPNVQNCGVTGHVAVVEAFNRDGTVHTSNYNWKVGRRGGPYVKTYTTFRLGPGVKFLWHT